MRHPHATQWFAGVTAVLLVTGLAAAQNPDQAARLKEVRTVQAPDMKALATAIVGAAQDEGFQIDSFDADTGIVRLYEEHRLVVLVDKGSTFSYCSGFVRVGNLSSCAEMTTLFRPAVVDDKGMVRTGRRVLFRPASDGHFDVLFELWDPKGDGFAPADKKERDRFHSRLNDRLDAMKRQSGGRFNVDSLRGAGVPAAEGPAGAYELETIGGERVPTQAVTFGMVSEAVYVLAADGTFRSSLRTNLGAQNAQGKYTLTGANVLFQSNRGLQAATLDGDTLTIVLGRAKWVYRRAAR